MTKYILHGGAAGRQTPDNKKFFLEAVKGLSDKVSVLCVLFAREKEVWNKSFEEVKTYFSSTSQQKVFSFVLANDKTSVLVEQIKQADVIYLRGGNSHWLQGYLAKVPDLKNLLAGKIVAGSSAGAFVLSKYYYENDDDTYNKGLGILPIKTFCHYSEEESDKLTKLKEFGENIETIYAIPEEKFFIIEQ